MSRWRRPSSLLAQAVHCRTAGDLLGEERLLRQCLTAAGAGRWRQTQEAEAAHVARFYMALAGCQLGRFSDADAHLAKLGLSARLSDAVWTGSSSRDVPEDFFVRVVDDGLPADLVEHTSAVLHPESEYWAAHRYDEEDVAFYSHAHRPGQELHAVDQLITALRPLLARVAPEVEKSLTMAEWWVHQRRCDQWHGHPMHFDTDEQLLRETRGSKLRHPAVSTVVYLSDSSPRFGPTLVTNQRARVSGSVDEEMAAVVEPRPGRALFFDGGYLHGAIPGQPWRAAPESPDRRLCVMVGWWTSPISPLPLTDTPRPLMEVDPVSSWVRSLPLAQRIRHVDAFRPYRPGLLTPIWGDVPGAEADGQPFAGRFFLTHRGQIDDDICL